MCRFLSAMLLFSCTVVGNQQAGREPQNEELLNPSLPSVYLQFEREVNRAPQGGHQGGESIWLRLHNNTRSAVSIQTGSLYVGAMVFPLTLRNGTGVLAIKEGTEVTPRYTVEALPDKNAKSGEMSIGNSPYQEVLLSARGGTFSTSWIAAGTSVIFAIPKEHLVGTQRIALTFNYEWEKSIRNIEHRVFFYAHELPNRRR